MDIKKETEESTGGQEQGDTGTNGDEPDRLTITQDGLSPPVVTPPTQRVLPSLTSQLASPVCSPGGDTSQHQSPLGPVKRFLCSLIKFGEDISPSVGDTVRNMVYRLLTENLGIGDFQRQLQEVTSFPVRPFVLPFLQSNIPLLKERIEKLALSACLPPLDFLASHQAVLQDSEERDSPSPGDSSSGSPVSQDREMPAELSLGKRKSSETGETQASQLAPKRPRSLSTLLSTPLFLSGSARGQVVRPQPWPPSSAGGSGLAAVAGLAQRGEEERGAEEEWKNVQVMLTCILGMVDKTQRAIRILQQRQTPPATGRTTEEVVTELQTRAHLAILEVKQSAVEQIRAATSPGAQSMCWHCGRPATETCSGCSLARYCGKLCQHKDWEEHHSLCGGREDKRRKKPEKREQRKGSSLQGEA